MAIDRNGAQQVLSQPQVSAPVAGLESSPEVQPHSKLHGRFLHITDMHPDLFYKAHTSTSEGIACHRSSGPAGYYGAETSDCDSPVRLVDSVFAWIKENVKDSIDFVIWTGDSARHDSDETIPRNASQVLGSNKLMVKKMIKLFSDDNGKLTVPIIPSLGNNDILPHNILMPAPNKWLRTYTNVWKSFIPESQLHSFEFGGWFYVEVIPNKLAVFSVNTLYFFDRNAGVDDCERPSEPGFMQMEWLRIQLTQMRARGVKAILTGHVPPARTDSKRNWDETCWQKYNLWMVQFRDVVVGSIYGHMNIDHFLLHDSNDIDISQVSSFVNKVSEDDQESDGIFHNEAASVSSSANYLVDLRHMWSKLPDPNAAANSLDSDFSVEKKKPWKGLGGKYAERYHLSLVSPSIVPNYFPTIRILSYNTTGLDGPTWSQASAMSAAEVSEASQIEIEELDAEAQVAMAMAKNKKKGNKGKKGKGKKGKGKPKDPNLVIPDGPAKGSPPGPGYAMQPLTWLGYEQYYANLTLLNNNVKDSQPTKKKTHRPGSKELRSVVVSEEGEQEGEGDGEGDVEEASWREGAHRHKELNKNPKPLPFKFQLEYSTFENKIYKLKDLTVKSYVKLAYRMAKHKSKNEKGGKRKGKGAMGGRGKKADAENIDGEESLDVFEREAEEEVKDAFVDEDDYEEEEEEVEQTAKKAKEGKGKGKGKGKDKDKKKKKKKKKNKAWRQFLNFAFVKTLDKRKIGSLDG
ncbi:hypothetical protein TD95_001920 [Thielaviopsis punctulata]|uniref:Endopolyphosphatase n=1 Tax=Thielaviopsis punctulata TaxID=72032 RepID=A0A0F4ZI55_9PEZI|nr:hypothetical protein TD95_001920 [Thielaviopsis punctulata]